MAVDTLVILDVQHAGKISAPDDRGATADLDGDGRTEVHEAEAELTHAWFAAEGLEGFYPYAQIVFRVTDASSHYHVPLLLSPYGYSTYRGS